MRTRTPQFQLCRTRPALFGRFIKFACVAPSAGTSYSTEER
jgi:hypothetical protein